MNTLQEYQKLTDFISKWIKPSDEDLEQLHSKLVIENYGKGDVLIKQGQICSSLKFVISGVYRVYQLNNGKEITSYFNYESRNPFIASFVSLLKAQPSNEIIECIVPGKVLSIKYSYWTALYNISQSFNTFGRLMAEFNYILAIERIESLQYLSASDRYEKFIKLYPDLLNMIPHHYISSYLGITPESLSRIRKVALKK
ncbi:hypothetical protein AWE51_02935 [Aquimarina aggregata]|uniref:Cyclic nucleotide-binding domain-containing protein n=1 Tax=Aquimarina aggregata TaxID=1642818 RepID=A0A162CUL0_9FLAO|nr:Crp/Fnr family transcriptional regulator [Aquimarina aggregata]KZS42414.1 hypothetical protein AWE51_02935 [Aquimarina aggregata]